jgi:subtilisin family serine protease/fibronectin type 3 domain-containing protein/methionine-rich copper-binding protein CopC
LRLEPLEDRTLLAAAGFDLGGPSGPLLIDTGSYDAQSVLVRYRSDDGPGAAAAANRPAWLDEVRARPVFSSLPGLSRVDLPAGVDIASALAAFRSDPRVLYAEPNYTIRLAQMPEDPQFSSLWGMHNVGQTGGTFDADIDAPEAWDITVGSGTTVVAVIDTGVDYTHEDLAANIWTNRNEVPGDGLDNDGNGYVDDVHGYDFINGDGDPMDDHNHGTHVAGTIGAVGDNGIGVAGVNWKVQIMALKFLGADGSGTTADAIEALEYAVANGATISNASWGGDPYSQALYDAIASARDADHVFVTAAGNGNIFGIGQNNDSKPFYPASYNLDNIIAVAAIDQNDNRAMFSNYGATSVDLGAPGVSILSTTRGDGYGSMSGTSMATPHVAGVAALIRDFEPQLGYRDVIDRMLSTVEPIDSLSGITVTGGRLNAAAAVLPPNYGPFIVDASPKGETSFPTSSLRVRFSKAVDPATFTPEDVVSFQGPQGAIPVTAITPLVDSGGREFEIAFPTQSEFGDYSLTLGPDVLDTAGNIMDQDLDGTGGETPDDLFSVSFSIVPYHGRFDFGTGASPLAGGFTRVAPDHPYDPASRYGWQAGTVFAVDRGVGTALTRDLNYSKDMLFAVDVPEGTFDVTLTVGDEGPYAHDQVGIFLEGTQADTVTTAGGEILTLSYTGLVIRDGQLNLRLADLGGADPYAVIVGLEVLWTGPDTSGPRVVASTPTGEKLDPLDRFVLTFDEPILQGSFTLEDVVELSGPAGPIEPVAVNALSATEYEVVFAEQTAAGTYRLSIGPEISDTLGNRMDQDGDGVKGEVPDDVFSTQFVLAGMLRFDFGTASSLVETGYTRVAPGTLYNASAGYGWQAGSVGGVDRGVGTALTRDLAYSRDMTFALDVLDGTYEVVLYIGDEGGWAHDQMGVFLEGRQLDTISTPPGEVLTFRYSGVEVSDGQLTVRLADLGGSDVYAVLCGLEVGPDTSGPGVVAGTPTGEQLGPLDRFVLTFNEPVLQGSFTTEDVVELSGPAGPIEPVAVNALSATEYEVVFAEQTAAGTYRLSIGPEILDALGNRMDQDGDRQSGEVPDDVYSTEVVLTGMLRFDFGTASSLVETGYTRVAPNTVYNASAGYGWQAGSVGGADRGVGTALTRDLAYSRDMTFAVDVLDGAYEVVLYIGDEGGWAHDQMGIFLEGRQVDTVNTPPGEVLAFRYSGVEVSGGQLTLRLADLGGSDVYAVLAGLEVGPDTSGPRVVACEPTGEQLGPFDRFVLTFDEPIAQGSFTLEDVAELSGPAGPIEPLAVNTLSETRYEVVFAEQTAAGAYRLSIGPEISDPLGNAMDQDGDGVGGEVEDDVFSTEVVLSGMLRFDFGTASSPLEAGYTRVAPNTVYSASAGYGWQAGRVGGVDRGVGTALTRDLAYSRDMTFALDVSDGVYEVVLYIGDEGGWAHDQMGIFLEGRQVDTVSTPPGEVLSFRYSGVEVSGGQLTLRLADLGGSDVYTVLAGLEVGPDTPGGAGIASVTESAGSSFASLDSNRVRLQRPGASKSVHSRSHLDWVASRRPDVWQADAAWLASRDDGEKVEPRQLRSREQEDLAVDEVFADGRW